MTTIICPKCGTENPPNATNCKNCRINLKFALEHPEEFERAKEEATHHERALPEIPLNTFPETAKAKSNRSNVAIVALLLTLPFAGCGIWLTTSSEGDTTLVFSGLGGLAFGLVTLIVGLHGLLSKPLLTIGDDVITVSGYILPNSNWSLPWHGISNAKLTGTAPTQVLWLESTGQPARVIENFRYERFDEMLKMVDERLRQLGHHVEVS